MSTTLEQDWRAYNKKMRRQCMHQAQFNTLREYEKYRNGTLKYTKEFTELEKKDIIYRRNAAPSPKTLKQHPLPNKNPTAKIKSPEYTGTLIKGISTMHKSNAVPVINTQEMIDHANMRR